MQFKRLRREFAHNRFAGMAPKRKQRITTESVTEITDELGEVRELLENQVAAGLAEAEVLSQMYAGWSERLTKLPKLSDKHKNAITKALASGPWSTEQKATLTRIVCGAGPVASDVARARPNQKCMHFENMMPMWAMANVRNTVRLKLLATMVR